MSLPLRYGPYLLESVLWCGQSSVLFNASSGSDPLAGSVIVKIPMLSLQRSSAFKQVFQERVAALEGCEHSLLVPIVASGRTHGLIWSASPRVHGWDADQVLAAMQRSGRRPSPRQVLTLGLRIADGLEALHETSSDAGPLVHGELRPSKLIFTPEGDLRLLLVSAASAAAGDRTASSTAERFAWRAPEQLLRQPETIRTDVRGLALLLFVLVTGANPFQRRTTARTCSAILQDQVLFEGDANLSSSLSSLLRAALSSDPERRPPTLRALAASLRNELMRQGGDEPWTPWIVGLQIAGALNAEREQKANAELDSLIARLARDAPRVESSHEAAPTMPARSPRATAPAPAPTPPVPPPSVFEGADADPTVLVPQGAGAGAGAARGKRSEPSGFTLVPDDVETPASAVARPLRRDPRRSDDLLPPEPESTDGGHAPVEDAHGARGAGAAKLLATGGAVDSSFVLVTDEPLASSVTVNQAGAQDTIPAELTFRPQRDDEEEALLPAMSAEEGMAELAREEARRGALLLEEEDEDAADPDSPMGASLSRDGGTTGEAARVSLAGAATAQLHAPQLSKPRGAPTQPPPPRPEPLPPAEPTRPLPPKAEVPRAEPPKPESTKPEPPRPESTKPEPPRPEPPRPEPPRPEPPRPEPPRPEPPRPEPPKAEPPRPQPTRPPPSRTEPEPVRSEPARSEPIRSEPIRPEPIRPEPVRPEVIRPAPQKTEPPRPEPVVVRPPPEEIQPSDGAGAREPSARPPPPATRPAASPGRPAWLVPGVVGLLVIVVLLLVFVVPGKDPAGKSGAPSKGEQPPSTSAPAGDGGSSSPSTAGSPPSGSLGTGPGEPTPPSGGQDGTPEPGVASGTDPSGAGATGSDGAPPSGSVGSSGSPEPSGAAGGTTSPTGGSSGAAAAGGGPKPQPSGTRAPPPVASKGPPGLIALKADTTTSANKVYLRGTMRGPFNRPAQAVQTGVGPNGGDQYIFTFRGVESQMSLTRIPVNSSYLTGVQISSSADVLELRVLVAANVTVNYGSSPDGFSITVFQPRTP